MATETTESSGTEATGSGRGKKIVTVAIAICLGLLVGGGAGAFAAGSLLPKAAPAASGAAESAGGSAGEHSAAGPAAEEEHEEGKGGEAAAPLAGAPTYLMENLVLNPAGTGGTRFLMVSVAFGVADEAAVETLKASDPQIRDALLGVLGTKTVAQLANIAARDSLKVELRHKVGGLFARGTVKQVYFPQFVIQ